ncbi:hypothetical protein WMW72_08210 [Paenibacillus filicis]|uniref:Uncharacterized protein n=1 Tax=Paenibacillus filicis TaxID=669464 RepID=A0ABU9DG77_9BACL
MRVERLGLERHLGYLRGHLDYVLEHVAGERRHQGAADTTIGRDRTFAPSRSFTHIVWPSSETT